MNLEITIIRNTGHFQWRRTSHTKRIWSFRALLAIANNWESWLNLTAEMEVVRFPIAFKGLGRSLLFHEDASGPYTLTIPDFDLCVTSFTAVRKITPK